MKLRFIALFSLSFAIVGGLSAMDQALDGALVGDNLAGGVGLPDGDNKEEVEKLAIIKAVSLLTTFGQALKNGDVVWKDGRNLIGQDIEGLSANQTAFQNNLESLTATVIAVRQESQDLGKTVSGMVGTVTDLGGRVINLDQTVAANKASCEQSLNALGHRVGEMEQAAVAKAAADKAALKPRPGLDAETVLLMSLAALTGKPLQKEWNLKHGTKMEKAKAVVSENRLEAAVFTGAVGTILYKVGSFGYRYVIAYMANKASGTPS